MLKRWTSQIKWRRELSIAVIIKKWEKQKIQENCSSWWSSSFAAAEAILSFLKNVMKNDAVWTDLAKFCHFGKSLRLWQIFNGLFLIWQNAEPTLANLLHYWANFHCCKWPNLEKYSNHLVTLLWRDVRREVLVAHLEEWSHLTTEQCQRTLNP